VRSGVRRDAAAIRSRIAVAEPVAPNVNELDDGDGSGGAGDTKSGIGRIGRTQPMKVCQNPLALLLVCIGAAAISSPVASATIVTASNGMTLYVFDKDKNGVPTCYNTCAKQWPPYLSAGAESRGVGWGTVKRKDGSMQWTYHNRPAYLYADDKKPGDANGDLVGRIWHAIRQ